MHGKRVLLIDDDIDSLRLNRIIFVKAGAQVITANDGLEGISKLHSHRPDLVVLDVMMPGGSGYEVCKQIRKISSVPVIMLTALGQEQNDLSQDASACRRHLTDAGRSARRSYSLWQGRVPNAMEAARPRPPSSQ